jgi:hypothetical protein
MLGSLVRLLNSGTFGTIGTTGTISKERGDYVSIR